jgi:1-acyl-sn-glycerol-3-phosphate acyltransferase
MKVEMSWEDPAAEVGRRPMLLLPRHVSTADTVLPVGIFSVEHGIRLRFVLKEELLWDPCLDIVGNRVPNCFVRRSRSAKAAAGPALVEAAQKSKAQSAAELERVRMLGRDMKPGDGVLIYPEGTRFTQGKRRALLEKASPELRGRVERFLRVLPPVPGGTLALLDGTLPGVDIWFCGHVGYEAAGSFKELINGGLIGKVVKIHLWKRRGEEVPADAVGRLAWLDAEWEKMDRWVQSVSGAPGTG